MNCNHNSRGHALSVLLLPNGTKVALYPCVACGQTGSEEIFPDNPAYLNVMVTEELLLEEGTGGSKLIRRENPGLPAPKVPTVPRAGVKTAEPKGIFAQASAWATGAGESLGSAETLLFRTCSFCGAIAFALLYIWSHLIGPPPPAVPAPNPRMVELRPVSASEAR